MKEEQTPGEMQIDEDPRARADRLISAALSLTRAIEMLSSAEVLGDLRPDVSRGVDFYEEVTRFEVVLIENALRLAHGKQVRAAGLLGLNNTTLNSKMKRYKINRLAFSNHQSTDAMRELSIT